MSVLIPPNTTRMRKKSQAPLLIHEVLPGEIMAIIFEEHAKLEWRAPAIDGRVCRLWRQITLNAPRAWTYLEICHKKPPTTSMLLSWLNRSRAAPLHIRVDRDFPLGDNINKRTLYELLRDYHTRIASLRMYWGDLSFFEGRDFPCMQHLEVRCSNHGRYSSPPVSWGHMPKLQSLRLNASTHTVSLEGLAPLKVLVLRHSKFTSLSQHSRTLVSLMLNEVKLGDAISGSLDFPSLTYLSLYDMSDLKPHINAPRLVTYHELAVHSPKSFSAPLHSLVEYGLLGLGSYRLTEWHSSFPNISKLSIRAGSPDLISFLNSLSIHPHLLPALQMISIRNPWGVGAGLTEKERGTMEDLVRVRSEACHLDVALYFETKAPFHMPLFFGALVSNPPDDMWCT